MNSTIPLTSEPGNSRLGAIANTVAPITLEVPTMELNAQQVEEPSYQQPSYCPIVIYENSQYQMEVYRTNKRNEQRLSLLIEVMTLVLVGLICGKVYNKLNPAAPTDDTDNEKGTPPLAMEVGNSGDRAAKFKATLYPEMAKSVDNSDNLVTSIFSIDSALAMLVNGAAGTSRDQLVKALFYDETPNPTLLSQQSQIFGQLKELATDKTDFTLANGLFGDENYTIKDSFIKETKKYFDAEVSTLDFSKTESVQEVNRWVNDKTNGKIAEMFDKLEPATKLILINAIYLKAKWVHQFDVTQTKKMDFKLPNGSKKSVKMMHQKTNLKLFHNNEANFQSLELPYEGDRLSMFIILPDCSSSCSSSYEEAFQNVEASIASGAEYDGAKGKVKVNLHLPRFKMTSEHDLKPMLIEHGVTDIFGPDANLSKIDAANRLFVSQIIQKAMIEVNEEGTEAAAVTAVASTRKCVPKFLEFKCDRPFLFLIRDRLTGIELFSGRVKNPEE